MQELAICIQSDQPTPETMNVIKNLGECMGRVTAQVIFKRWFVSTSVKRQLEGMLRVSLIINKVFLQGDSITVKQPRKVKLELIFNY